MRRYDLTHPRAARPLAVWIIVGALGVGGVILAGRPALAQTPRPNPAPAPAPAEGSAPGWIDAIQSTLRQGTPSVLVVTSAIAPGSHESAQSFLNASAVRLLQGQVAFAEISAEAAPQYVQGWGSRIFRRSSRSDGARPAGSSARARTRGCSALTSVSTGS